MTKRNFIIAGGFVALYTIGWFILAAKAQATIDELLKTQKQNGIEISYSNQSKSGFPFFVAVRFSDFTLKNKAGLTLDAPIVTAGTGLANWSHVTTTATAGMVLTIPAGKTRGEIKAAIATAKGSIDPNAMDLTLNAVTATGLITGADPLSAVTITLHSDRPDAPPTDHTQAGIHVIANADGVIIPGAAIPALGNNIKRLTIDTTVMGKLSALDEPSLQAWSNDGGTLEVHELSTDWGPLGLGLGGTLALDPNLQPLASFNAKITGFTQTLDALAETHAVKPSSAALASVGLGLLAKPEGPNDVPTVEVPITIQNGLVYVSSFKLAKMPMVRLY